MLILGNVKELAESIACLCLRVSVGSGLWGKENGTLFFNIKRIFSSSFWVGG